MRTTKKFAALGIVAALLLPASAGAASILGGVVTISYDTISVGGDGTLGNVATTTANASSASPSGSVQLFGGGGDTYSTGDVGGLLNGGGFSLTLPGSVPLVGDPGNAGAPGTPGVQTVTYASLGSAGGGAINQPSSGRLQALLQILKDRAWLRYALGKTICLPQFGAMEVTSVLPREDWNDLQAALPQFYSDIATLRQMLANCRDPKQRQALNISDLNRVVGLSVGANGVPVLHML